MTRISVIITSYNQKELLKEAIDSVLNQTLKPFEILVCDDASWDGSQEVIREYEQRYPGVVKGVLNEVNGGVSRNRNSGLEKVQGDLVTWLDGDDTFLPTKLERELAYFQADPDVKWVYSQVNIRQVSTDSLSLRYAEPVVGRVFSGVVGHIGRAPRNFLVEYEALKKVGFFDESMSIYEDFDLLLRLAHEYDCTYNYHPALEYRVHESGLHRSQWQRHTDNFQVLNRNLGRLIAEDPVKERQRSLHVFMRCWYMQTHYRARRDGRYVKALYYLLRVPASYMVEFVEKVFRRLSEARASR